MEYSYSDAKAKIDQLTSNKESFSIFGLSGDLLEASAFVEKAIESRGMTCRVYTRNRTAASGVGALFAGAGVLSLAAIAVHNIFTYNPDWELGRSIGDNKLYVDYKK